MKLTVDTRYSVITVFITTTLFSTLFLTISAILPSAKGHDNHGGTADDTVAYDIRTSFCSTVDTIVEQVLQSNSLQCWKNEDEGAEGSGQAYSLPASGSNRNENRSDLESLDKLFELTPRPPTAEGRSINGRSEQRDPTNGECGKTFLFCGRRNRTHECYQGFKVTADQDPWCRRRSVEGSDEVVNYDSINRHQYEPSREEEAMHEGAHNEQPGMEEHHHPAPSKVWLYGFLCCTAEIVLARVGVMVLPLMRKDLYEKLILTMVGLAAGTLTGSAIFHLLPKAFSLERYYENDRYLRQCLEIAGGVWLFLVIERALKIVFFYNERKISHRRDSNIGNVLALPSANRLQDSMSVIYVSSQMIDANVGAKGQERAASVQTDQVGTYDHRGSARTMQAVAAPGVPPASSKYNPDPEDLHPIRFQEGSLSSVSTEAWMIIFGDGFLDFVDGVSIGTGFQDSLLTGFSISLGILLEELPHELGEFAVLLNAGLSFKQALVLKFISSCTTYLGLCMGVWLGGIEAGHIVFAIAAGMFLYIALVDMMPELNAAAAKSSKDSVFRGFKVLVLQNFGLLIGMAVIYVMALYEDLFRKL